MNALRLAWQARFGGRPWLLVFSLLLLHLALTQGVDAPVGRGLLVGHVGSVLLWQPLVKGDRRLSALELVVWLGLAALVSWRASWGLMLYWSLFLAGMLGGRLFTLAATAARLQHWMALIYLAFALIGLILPEILPGSEQPPELLGPFVAGLTPLLFLLMLAIRAPERPSREGGRIDFVGSLLMVLVLGGVMLGALTLMFVGGRGYLQALLQASFITAGGLLLLGWVWNPRAGFVGLGLEIARHVMSGGRAFEHWLDELARLAVNDPGERGGLARFLAGACQGMLAWPGVAGVRWALEGQAVEGGLGRCISQPARFAHGPLVIQLYGWRDFNPTLLWQADLMVRLLAQFTAARMQAERLRAMSYVHAVHETGARMTHEVKNLLQSLDTLCFALAHTEAGREADLQAMLGRQLPAISQRLHEALARIRQPVLDADRPVAAGAWWAALQARFDGLDIQFVASLPNESVGLPGALFDTVADNLLRNALDKRAEGAFDIRVTLDMTQAGGRLSVQDGGQAIPRERAAILFAQPLGGGRGLGIGLYQSARLAEAAGYQLALAENQPGCVLFRLSLETATRSAQDGGASAPAGARP